jgi:general secretion pathway protein D
LAAAAEVVRRVDVPRLQVRITALLYDVDVEVIEQCGINWGTESPWHIGDDMASATLLSKSIHQLSAGAAATAEAAAGGGAEAAASAASPVAMGTLTTLHYAKGKLDITNYIQMLDQTDGARLLARPTVMAYDRYPAEIKIVSEIPVQQLTETSQGGAIGTTEFREAGITLTVTPEISQDNTVLLDIKPEFSVLAGFSGSGQPIIDKRSTNTKVQVIDGQTLVLGGLLRRSEMETVRGIPGLMHWKYIGKIFSAHETTINDSELIVFIKTEIINLGYNGDHREEMAWQVSNDILERLPPASIEPVVPPCRDPHCPYHCPDSPYRQRGFNPCCHSVAGMGGLHGGASCGLYGGCPPDPYGKPEMPGESYDVADAPMMPEAPPLPPPPAVSAPVQLNPQAPADVEAEISPPAPVILQESSRRGGPRPVRTALRRLPSVGGQKPYHRMPAVGGNTMLR